MAKMRFKENKFLHDPNVPYFEAGKIYEVAKENVERWLKRGGTLIDEEAAELKAKAAAAKRALEAAAAELKKVPESAPKVEDHEILGDDSETKAPEEKEVLEAEEKEDEDQEKSAPKKPQQQQHGKRTYHRKF